MICSERGIKPTNACKESGVGGSFINDIERGRVPSVVKVQMLADYLGVTTSELLGEASGTTPGAIRISVLGTIPAGIPIDAVEDILDWEEIPVSWTTGDREYFGLRVKGDSMYPRYLEGDTVILRKQSTCDSGDDCAVMVNGNDATLKQVILRGDRGLELRPVNTAYPPKSYSPAEIESLPVQIIGVVVELRRKIK
ncbi:LexA family transcriptional regulator [Intestinimonas sp. CLA-AA-H199]|nr:LexA family transcriptional regulator [Intestinimonas aquisgranensis]